MARQLKDREPQERSADERAAVTLILRTGPRGSEALFILRAEHPEDPWSGHMGLPGGRVEPADAGLLEAAIRETREEVSIDLRAHGRLLGQLDDVQAFGRGRRIDMVIRPFVFELVEPVHAHPNAEVQEVHWISFEELLDEASASTMPWEYQGTHLMLPCYRVRDRVIWGLTYRMLQLFFGVIGTTPR